MPIINSNIPEKSEEWLKGLETQVRAVVKAAAVRAAILGEKRVKDIIQREAYDTGRGLRSVTSSVRETDTEVIMALGTNLDYMMDVEHGRLPGKWPNLDAMVRWCGRRMRRQGINARVNISFDDLKALAKSGKRGHKTEAAKIARKQLTMLYLVGRKIATKGIKQKLIFFRIRDGLLSVFRQDVAKGLQSLR